MNRRENFQKALQHEIPTHTACQFEMAPSNLKSSYGNRFVFMADWIRKRCFRTMKPHPR